MRQQPTGSWSGKKCAQTAVVIANVFVMLVGLVLTLSIVSLTDNNSAARQTATGLTFRNGAALAITSGCFLVLLGSSGCAAAILQKRWTVVTHIILSATLAIVQLGAFVAGIFIKPQLDNLDDAVQRTFATYNTSAVVRESWNIVERVFRCCGIATPDDYYALGIAPKSGLVPSSCCNTQPFANKCSALDGDKNTSDTIDWIEYDAQNGCAVPQLCPIFVQGCSKIVLDYLDTFAATIAAVAACTFGMNILILYITIRLLVSAASRPGRTLINNRTHADATVVDLLSGRVNNNSLTNEQPMLTTNPLSLSQQQQQVVAANNLHYVLHPFSRQRQNLSSLPPPANHYSAIVPPLSADMHQQRQQRSRAVADGESENVGDAVTASRRRRRHKSSRAFTDNNTADDTNSTTLDNSGSNDSLSTTPSSTQVAPTTTDYNNHTITKRNEQHCSGASRSAFHERHHIQATTTVQTTQNRLPSQAAAPSLVSRHRRLMQQLQRVDVSKRRHK